MSQQIIDLSAVANDHHGDKLRTGGQKINDNFSDLYAIQSRTVNAGDIRFQGGATTEDRINLAIAQAVVEQASAVYVPAFMLPYNASLVTFDTSVRMVREGGERTTYDIRAYGAAGDGIIDDYAAIQAAITGSADRGIAVATAGTYVIGQTLVYPAGQRTRFIGAGQRFTIIQAANAGVSVLVSIAHSHIVQEYHSSLEALQLDGANVSTGPLLDLVATSLVRLRDIELRNPAGDTVRYFSTWDTLSENMYVAVSGAGTPVVLDADVAHGACTENRFFSFHVEGDAGAFPLVDFRGTATANVALNHFYYAKIHGNPTTAGPTISPVRLGAYAVGNKFLGGEIAYGKTCPQVEISGNRNMLEGLEFIVGGAGAPTYAVSILAGQDNYLLNLISNSSAYTSGFIHIASGVARTKIRAPTWHNALATPVTDLGFQTDFEQSYARQGLTDGANVAVNPLFGRYCDLAAGGSRAIQTPSNPINGHELEIMILNNTLGAITTTFDAAAYLLGDPWTDPAAGKRRTIRFRYTGQAGLNKWVESSRSTADA